MRFKSNVCSKYEKQILKTSSTASDGCKARGEGNCFSQKIYIWTILSPCAGAQNEPMPPYGFAPPPQKKTRAVPASVNCSHSLDLYKYGFIISTLEELTVNSRTMYKLRGITLR